MGVQTAARDTHVMPAAGKHEGCVGRTQKKPGVVWKTYVWRQIIMDYTQLKADLQAANINTSDIGGDRVQYTGHVKRSDKIIP